MKKITLTILVFVFTMLLFSQVFIEDTSTILTENSHPSAGSSWIDYDNDNDLDLFVMAWYGYNKLFESTEEGFIEVENNIICSDYGIYTSCAWGDYDNDGDKDLYLTDLYGDNKFYVNLGNGEFIDQTNLINLNSNIPCNDCLWFDYDNDGDLDLLITRDETYGGSNLMFNNIEGEFELDSDCAITQSGNNIYSNTATICDYDNDSDIDLFIANSYSVSNIFFENIGEGVYEINNSTIIDNYAQNSSIGYWEDFNDDGYFDLYVANSGYSNKLDRVFINTGNDSFIENTNSIFSDYDDRTTDVYIEDFDCDGDKDIMTIVYDGNSKLFINDGLGDFYLTDENIFNHYITRGATLGDYNSDGFWDIFFGTQANSQGYLYYNVTNNNNWIKIKLIGTISNRDGFGSKLKINATINETSKWQYKNYSPNHTNGQNQNIIHFGLGDAPIIDSLVVYWPSGIEQVLTDIPVNQEICITEEDNDDDPITLQIDNTVSGSSMNKLVPVYLTNNTSELYSAQISFELSDNITFNGVILENSLMGNSNWSCSFNVTEEQVLFASAGSQPILDDGILFYIDITSPESIGNYPLNFFSAMFNESLEPITINGNIEVFDVLFGDVDMNGIVQAFDASQILRFLTEEIELNEYQQYNADVSLDGSVSALDAMFILQYVTEIIDNLPIQPAENMNNPVGSIEFTEISADVGEFVEIPINILNQENIYSFYFNISFDPEIFSFVTLEDSSCSQYLTYEFYQSDDNLLISGYNSDGNELSELPSIKFFIPESAQFSSSEISFDEICWNENNPIINSGGFIVNNQFSNVPDSEFEHMKLSQNYPNPFNPYTTISFYLKISDFIDLSIYNIKGQKVKTLADDFFEKGSYNIQWNGKDENGNEVKNGILFYKLKTKEEELSRKMILLK